MYFIKKFYFISRFLIKMDDVPDFGRSMWLNHTWDLGFINSMTVVFYLKLCEAKILQKNNNNASFL